MSLNPPFSYFCPYHLFFVLHSLMAVRDIWRTKTSGTENCSESGCCPYITFQNVILGYRIIFYVCQYCFQSHYHFGCWKLKEDMRFNWHLSACVERMIHMFGPIFHRHFIATSCLDANTYPQRALGCNAIHISRWVFCTNSFILADKYLVSLIYPVSIQRWIHLLPIFHHVRWSFCGFTRILFCDDT